MIVPLNKVQAVAAKLAETPAKLRPKWQKTNRGNQYGFPDVPLMR
jgi:hypothetical protein